MATYTVDEIAYAAAYASVDTRWFPKPNANEFKIMHIINCLKVTNNEDYDYNDSSIDKDDIDDLLDYTYNAMHDARVNGNTDYLFNDKDIDAIYNALVKTHKYVYLTKFAARFFTRNHYLKLIEFLHIRGEESCHECICMPEHMVDDNIINAIALSDNSAAFMLLPKLKNIEDKITQGLVDKYYYLYDNEILNLSAIDDLPYKYMRDGDKIAYLLTRKYNIDCNMFHKFCDDQSHVDCILAIEEGREFDQETLAEILVTLPELIKKVDQKYITGKIIKQIAKKHSADVLQGLIEYIPESFLVKHMVEVVKINDKYLP